MTSLEKHRLPGPLHSARRVKLAVAGVCSAAALVVVPMGTASAASLANAPTLDASVGVARAGSVDGTKAQVAALEAEIRSVGTRVHTYTAAYARAAAEASVLAGQLRSQRGELGHLERHLTGARTALRRAAVDAYTGSGAGDPLDVTSSTKAVVGAEYLQVASSDVNDIEHNYQDAQVRVSGAIERLVSEQRSNDRTLEAAATARQGALQTAAADQSRLGALQSRLVTLEATAAQGAPVNDGVVKAAEQATGGTATTDASTPTTTAPATPAPSAAPATSPASAPPSTTPVSPAPSTTAPPPPAPPTAGSGGVWLRLRECESGDNYRENTGNGFYGAYQFSQQTWTGLGYPGRPDLESPAMQDAAAIKLQAEAGWDQWPACAAELGLT